LESGNKGVGGLLSAREKESEKDVRKIDDDIHKSLYAFSSTLPT
jgi:hypothetical protein